MSRVLRESEDYKRFKSQVALQKVATEEGVWRCWSLKPRPDAPVIVMLPGVSGSAQSFYELVLMLAPRGYHVVAADWPPLTSHALWLSSFRHFLHHHLGPDRVPHLLGTALGGYLALLYAQEHPSRVKSVILCQGFGSTSYWAQAAPPPALLPWLPRFLLESMVFNNYPSGDLPPPIADSVDWMVQEVRAMSSSELSARLRLQCTEGPPLTSTRLPLTRITRIEALDEVALPQPVRDQLQDLLPKVPLAQLRMGGNFPFLSVPDEVALHIEVHLRRVEHLEEGEGDH